MTLLALAVSLRWDFEGGSLGRVEPVAATHFRAHLAGQVDQDGRNRQANWYYFRIDGAKGVEVTVDLVNLPGEYNYRPNRGAVTKDTVPVWSEDRRTWRHFESTEFDAKEPRLRLRATPKSDPFWIAHVPPYTGQDLARLLGEFKANRSLRVESVGRSVGGREIPLLTITDPRAPDSGKRVAWLMFRQHSWETGSSWAGEGLVRFLLADTAESAGIRRTMLFKVFPLCDPDGTAGGAVRFNAHGFDLNRNWDLDDSAKMPEIAAQRRAIENWVDSGHKLDLFLSLHNTETGEYLEAPPGDNPAHWSLAERFFAALGQVSTFAPTRKLFRAEATTTAGKPGRMTVSQGLYHRRKLPAFIMEQMIASNPRLGRLPTVEDRMRFGEGLAQAVALAVREPVVAWPQFRGPGAGGVGTGSPPVEWDGASGKNVVWKTPIPGLGYSSPVVWGDRVFLSSAVSDNDSAVKLGLYGDIQPVQNEGPQRFVVLCLDRKSGKVLWQRTAASGVARVKRHPKSSHANPTPATDGKRLVVSFGSEGLYAFDLDGKQLWKKDLGLLDAGYFRVPAAQWGYASSPVLHDGVVVVQADVQKDSFLAAFHADTGKELWRTPRADVPTFGSPAVLPHAGGGAQVVVNGWKHIGGYDFKTGRELWKMEGTGDIPVPTPVFGSDRIVVTSAHGGGRPVYALRTDGSVAWSRDRLGNYMQTPLLLDGIGYFCYDNGVLTALQLSTGEQLYQQRLGGGTTGFTSSAVAADGRLYITSEDGRTHVVAAGGAFKLLGTNELGEPVMASAAIVDGVLLLRGQRHLFAIGRR